ncbi:MAG: hypothetical protein ACP5FT_04130 [Acidilobus sp.]
MRALVISSPTVDEILVEGSSTRTLAPGGPGLFAGLALRRLGYEVCAAGVYGPDTVNTVKVEESIGVRRVCCEGEAGFLIRHVYDASGSRRTTIITKPRPLRAQELTSSLTLCRPDLIIVSPNYDEFPLELLGSFREAENVVLDVQGYVRSMGMAWIDQLPHDVIRLAHMSDDDGPIEVARRLASRLEAVLYTLGPGGAIAFTRGLATALPSRGPRLEDRTGAGDVITALTSHYYVVEGLTLEEAYDRALEKFHAVMEEARSIRGRAFIGYAGPAEKESKWRRQAS